MQIDFILDNVRNVLAVADIYNASNKDEDKQNLIAAVDVLLKHVNDRYTFSKGDEYLRLINSWWHNTEVVTLFEESLAADKPFKSMLVEWHIMSEYRDDLIALAILRYLVKFKKMDIFESNEASILMSRASYYIIATSPPTT